MEFEKIRNLGSAVIRGPTSEVLLATLSAITVCAHSLRIRVRRNTVTDGRMTRTDASGPNPNPNPNYNPNPIGVSTTSWSV